MTGRPDIRLAMETARTAVNAAAEASLPYFRANPRAETKADGSLVTVADKAADAAALNAIRAAWPDSAILTEESGEIAGDAAVRWIIDPLDGTHRFARGSLFWGPLIALEHNGDIIAGAASLPAVGETYWAARGLGAFRNGERIRVSAVADWSSANLGAGGIGRLLRDARFAQGAAELARTAEYVVSGGDLAGALMVASGQTDAWIEFGVKVWDLAPLKIIVEEAGGRFTDLSGAADERSLEKGEALATNGVLHEHALRTLRG